MLPSFSASAFTLALPAVLLLAAAARWLHRRAGVRRLHLLTLAAAAAISASICWSLEQGFWGLTGLQLAAQERSVGSSLAAMVGFAAPLEEGVKLLLVWAAFRRGWLRSSSAGVLASLTVATGFNALSAGLGDLSGPLWLTGTRYLLGAIADLFFAACWGLVLTTPSLARWLRFVWFATAIFHGLFNHIVFWRGAGTLAAVAPALLVMFGVGWLILRELERNPNEAVVVAGPRLGRLTGILAKKEQPVMVHWILIGGLVTTGVVLVAFIGAVYVGHRLGIDFAAADEANVRSNGPLVLLGSAMMGAFPVAGYLTARASGTRSVLEPAMGAAASMVTVVLMLSMTAPMAIVFALAIAPLAFGLACVGAWFGLSR